MAVSQEELIENISSMTVLELSQLVKALEEKFGVSAAAMAAAPVASVEAAAEEKTEFDVILKAMGAEKIKVIKEVRTLTGLGLKEAKDLVESAGDTCFIKKGLPKDEADKIVQQLKAVGADAVSA